MAVSARGRTWDHGPLGLENHDVHPWVVRVVLGAKTAVWNTMHRPSLEYRASSSSSPQQEGRRQGDLSE